MSDDRKDAPKGKAAPKQTEAGPEIPPHRKEAEMRAHEERRKDEPGAAPMTTDAESGGASAAMKTPAGQPPNDPVRPHTDEKERVPRREVRAGPGDAGAQDAPEVLPKTPRSRKTSWARIGLWFAVPIAILLALYWAGWV